MSHKIRVLIRIIVALVCVGFIIHLQTTVSRENLLGMLLALAGLLAVLFDYNYDFNHPKRDSGRMALPKERRKENEKSNGCGYWRNQGSGGYY